MIAFILAFIVGWNIGGYARKNGWPLIPTILAGAFAGAIIGTICNLLGLP